MAARSGFSKGWKGFVDHKWIKKWICTQTPQLELVIANLPNAWERMCEAGLDTLGTMTESDRLRKLYVFSMRSMAGGGAFHRAYYHATQQAFLEAHEFGFRYFGGVFRRLRYDNLKSAVKKILRGHRREETERFIAFRSHWGFETEFCNPARGNEKGGVEGFGPPHL